MSEIFNSSTQDLMSGLYGWYVFTPVLLGLLLWKRLNKVQRLIFYIGVVTAANHTLSSIVREMFQLNVWLYHIYVPILFWLTWRVYKMELKALFSKRAFNILLSVVLAFFVFNSAFIQGFKTTPTYAIFILSGIFIFWCFSYFYSLLKQTQYKSLEKEPLFWFTTGVLMYYSSTILIFLLVFNFLAEDTEATYIALILNAFFNLVLITAYLISIWVKPPR